MYNFKELFFRLFFILVAFIYATLDILFEYFNLLINDRVNYLSRAFYSGNYLSQISHDNFHLYLLGEPTIDVFYALVSFIFPTELTVRTVIFISFYIFIISIWAELHDNIKKNYVILLIMLLPSVASIFIVSIRLGLGVSLLIYAISHKKRIVTVFSLILALFTHHAILFLGLIYLLICLYINKFRKLLFYIDFILGSLLVFLVYYAPVFINSEIYRNITDDNKLYFGFGQIYLIGILLFYLKMTFQSVSSKIYSLIRVSLVFSILGFGILPNVGRLIECVTVLAVSVYVCTVKSNIKLFLKYNVFYSILWLLTLSSNPFVVN